MSVISTSLYVNQINSVMPFDQFITREMMSSIMFQICKIVFKIRFEKKEYIVRKNMPYNYFKQFCLKYGKELFSLCNHIRTNENEGIKVNLTEELLRNFLPETAFSKIVEPPAGITYPVSIRLSMDEDPRLCIKSLIVLIKTAFYKENYVLSFRFINLNVKKDKDKYVMYGIITVNNTKRREDIPMINMEIEKNILFESENSIICEIGSNVLMVHN